MRPLHSPPKQATSLKKQFRLKSGLQVISRSLEKKSFHPVSHSAYNGLILPVNSDHLLLDFQNSKDKQKCRNKSSKTRPKIDIQKKDKENEHKRKILTNGKKFVDSKLEKKLEGYFLFLSLSQKCLRAPKIRKGEQKYIVYIGKGNNSKLLRKIFKWRHWWQITNNPETEGINLIWTQWSKKSLLDRITEFKPVEEEEKLARIVCQNVSSQQGKKHLYSNQFNILLSRKERDPSKSAYVECEADVKGYLQSHTKKSKGKKEVMEEEAEIEKRRKKRERISFTCNHIEGHESITDKKNLFLNLTKYCLINEIEIQKIVPLTFHIQGGEEELCQIERKEQEMKQNCMWILKPGERSNRGNGIKVFKRVQDIKQYVEREKKTEKHPDRTYIIQKYIMPALFHRRKFDIRCFVLVVASPKINAYIFQEGYLRTSSKEFKDKKCDDKLIHLTNDAIQKKAIDYGKFEKGNKVGFDDYQNYLDLFEKKKSINFRQEIWPLMKVMAAQLVAASSLNGSCKSYSFELLGLDFMLDEEYKPWLIEANTNPCLETGCPILDTLIPNVVNSTIKLAVDCLFKPPKLSHWPLQSLITFPEQILEPNKFQLIYTEFGD